jgi:addiction module HigA family antidote
MIFNPAHPGEVLRDYLGKMKVGEAASRLGVTRAHLSRILNGRAGVSAEMSLRLSAALGTSPDFWLKMQANYDLWRARKASNFKVRPFPHVVDRNNKAVNA